MQTKLVNKLGQRLALTPQLTQSLKVLAMNAMELDAYVEECLESNPLLEVEQEEIGSREPATADTDTDAWRETGDNRWEQMYTSGQGQGGLAREQQWQGEETLSDNLHQQVDQQPMDADVRAIAHAIIDSLDDDGYFRTDTEDLAGSLGVDSGKLIQVLEEVVQQLEPAGIGARSLSECLLLQLDGSDPNDALVRRLLLHFREHLFASDEQLAKLAECSVDELSRARARMRRLDPFPGHGLRGQTNIYIQPEVIFRRLPDGEIHIEIPAYGWQGLRLNNPWQGHQWKKSERAFVDAAVKEAKWLLYALDQRRETLYKVATCLARCQRDFLEHGMLGLKPLTLQDVAAEVGLHESTISRVTNGKYAETPLGLIEMRRFFSAGLPTRGGGTISVYRVQQRVKALIESEPAGRPISDQAIADRLWAEGIEIARRTVAKYRESLGLPPSAQRRRQSAAAKTFHRR